MTDVLFQQLGAVGVIIAAAGTYILRLHNALQESQERRVADAQAVTSKILELVEAHSADKAALAEAISANTAAVHSLKERLPRRSSE